MPYSARCKHCGRVIVTASRIADAELARLRVHVRSAHPREALHADAGLAETLRHLDVGAEGEA